MQTGCLLPLAERQGWLGKAAVWHQRGSALSELTHTPDTIILQLCLGSLYLSGKLAQLHHSC